MQKGQTGIFVLLGIVIIAFVGVAFYAGKITPKPPSEVVTSTPSPTPSPSLVEVSPAPIGVGETANWKTYTNEVNKFSLRYPKEWREEERGGALVLLTPEPIKFKGGQIQGIFIGVMTNKSKVSSREYLDQVAIPAQKGSLCEDNIKVISNVPDSLKNLDITITDGFCGVFNQGPQMFISKGNNIIVLSSSLYNINRNLVNQIYETFKFLK